MKTKEEIKEFILKTLLPYKEDPSTCGSEGGDCIYLTSDGRKCAFGKWMKEGVWQQPSDDNASGIIEEYGAETVLMKEAFEMNFAGRQWNYLQSYHDSIAGGESNHYINTDVKTIERIFDIELPELKF